jgi:3-oxoacyl-[acyl-carrier protein] reductase
MARWQHVALVTGANHGIGAAISERLAAEGCAVVISYFAFDGEDEGTPERLRASRRQDASGVVRRITESGGHAVAVSADLREAAGIPALFDLAEKQFGPVDILVNNATGSLQDTFRAHERDWIGRAVTRVSARTFDQQFGVDARGGAILIAEFAQRLVARGGDWGRIISMISGGEKGWPGEVSYAAAKAALLNYTLSASLELSRFGVTANAVHPPVTDTGWVTDAVRQAVAKDDNFFGVAEPFEVGDVIAFLVSEAGRRVTGSVLRMG